MSAYINPDNGIIFIEAHELCQYVFRSGDIDRFSLGCANGQTIASHALWQRPPKIADAYFTTKIVEGLTVRVYTFPEGVYKIENKVAKYAVEHSYTVPYPLDYIDNGELDIALQTMKISAYVVCDYFKAMGVEEKVVFFRERSDESRTFDAEADKEELRENFEQVLQTAFPFLKLLYERVFQTTKELSSLKFPFPGGAREGQKDFIKEAFITIKSHRRLLVEAPTGTGKTMASLYPSLKALGDGTADKIFYFTGKTTTSGVCLNAIDLMRKDLKSFRAVHITAKDKNCKIPSLKNRQKCNPKDCPYARAFYDKINGALYELLSTERTYTKEIINRVAEQYEVCPYELSLELSEWCDLVVCDYNYLFDLRAYLRRYFVCPDANYIFLFDEAHNLPDRAKEMFSESLYRSQIDSLWQRYGNDRYLSKPLESLRREMETLYALTMQEKQEIGGEVCGFYINSSLPDELFDELQAFLIGAKKHLSKDVVDDELADFTFTIRKLCDICGIFDKHFTFYAETHGQETMMRILCLDASPMLNEGMKKGVASILFSATLKPFDYYADLLGCQKSQTLSLPSPFDQKKLCLLHINQVSTRFEDRKKNAPTIANIIRASIAGKEGNYIVYFPSYSYLEEVKKIFCEKYPTIHVTAQSRSMSEKAKETFLDSFDDKKEGTLVGFCVLGGSFAEGIDLRGERLIGAIIVGVGLPTISNEQNIIKDYYDRVRENGYAYAYTYPGMNKVLQAAGRVIRSEEEKGIVVLVDDRFITPDYRPLLPSYWSHLKSLDNAKDLLAQVNNFWKK